MKNTDSMLRLHSVDPSQKPALWQLYKRCYEPTIRSQFGGWNDAEHLARFETIWQEVKLRAIHMDGLLIGCLGVGENSDCHELLEIQIDPAYQNQGIGTVLIQGLIMRAKMEGKQLYLNVFRASPARRLYECLGFKIIGSSEHQHRMVYRPEMESEF